MKTQNKVIVQELQFIRTTDLLIAKVTCIRWISILSTVKSGAMALVAILLANFIKSIIDGTAFDLTMFLSLVCAFYTIIFILLIDYVFLSKSKARKELINDIFAMRNAKATPYSPKVRTTDLEKNTSNEN